MADGTREPKTHADLQADLARTLLMYSSPPLVFTEVALSGSWGSHGRLDVVALWTFKGYSRQRINGYEVKATRPDLLADLRSGKWRRYLPDVDHMYMSYNEGMATPDEIPRECGIIVRRESGRWRVIRGAPRTNSRRDPTTPWRLLRRAARGQGVM